MDTEFDLSLWKSSALLPAFSISFILILGILIFISSPINLMYIQKNSSIIKQGKFKIPVSFKTLYTISGAEFLIGGMIQSLIYVKGIKNIFFWINTLIILGSSRYDTLLTFYNITFIQLVMLCCHLFTDQQAKMYARRRLNAMIELQRENLNTNGKIQIKSR